MDGNRSFQSTRSRPDLSLPGWSWRVALILLLAGLLWLSPLLTTAVHAEETVVHVVKAGETLSTIARRYGVSLYRLAAYNGLRNPNLVRVGQQLRIPPASATSAPVAQPTQIPPKEPTSTPPYGGTASTSTPSTPQTTPETHQPETSVPTTESREATPTPSPSGACSGGIRYVVQRYDTLWGISRRYGVSVEAISTRNRLHSFRIYQGQMLIIPCP